MKTKVIRHPRSVVHDSRTELEQINLNFDFNLIIEHESSQHSRVH